MIDDHGFHFDGESWDELMERITRGRAILSITDVADGELTDDARDAYESGTQERRLLQPLMDFMEEEPPKEWFGPSVPDLPGLTTGDTALFHSVIHLVSDLHLDDGDRRTGWFTPSRKGPYRQLISAIRWLRRDAASHRVRFGSENPTLHVVGDWFDIWQGCKSARRRATGQGERNGYAAALRAVGQRNANVLREFKRYADDGNRVVYTGGNHDMEVLLYPDIAALARAITGIGDLEIGRYFVEPKLNMIGMHGHQADVYNADKTVGGPNGGSWAPGEILVRNGNRDWLIWQRNGRNMRMFVLSAEPQIDGPLAMVELMEYGRIRRVDAVRLLRSMARSLQWSGVSPGAGASIEFILDTFGHGTASTVAELGAQMSAIFDFEISSLRHLAMGERDELEVDGERDSHNDRYRRLFRRIYTRDRDGRPYGLRDFERKRDDEDRIDVPPAAQWRISRAVRAIGPAVSVSGHTHFPELSGTRASLYLNTGCWTDRWHFDSSRFLGERWIRYAFPVSTISRIYKLFVEEGVHDIVVELYQFNRRPVLLARRRMRVRYG